MRIFSLPPDFYTLGENEAWVSPQKHFVSEGGFQQGVNRVWALDFDVWRRGGLYGYLKPLKH